MLVDRWKWKRVRDAALGALSEGGIHRNTVDGLPICWVKQDGRLHALVDRCPHQGAALSHGWCADGLLVCPIHRYRFDPATGRGLDGEGERAEVLPVDVRPDGVYLGRQTVGLRLFGLDIF